MRPKFIFHILNYAIGLAILSTAATANGQTWVQWPAAQGGNNHYYALTTVETNWVAAEKIAVKWGGTLATITSPEEQAFINATFLNGALDRRPVWIGLSSPPKKNLVSGKFGPLDVQIGIHQSSKTAGYHWVTGEKLDYSNWHPNQPDNFGGGENYAAINWFYSDNRGTKGDWNDTPLDGTTGFGGTTTGPYFGIVERNFDPSLPVPQKINLPGASLILFVFVALGFGAAYLWRGRRKLGGGPART